MQITNVKCPKSKYSIKCPYEMKPEYITVHNTYNDASAMAEISYMLGNNLKTSFHAAVDDYRVVTGLPFNRNGWHAGDGRGKGNMKSIGIEICYSKSGGKRFEEAEELAAEYIAYLLKKYGWGIERVKKHQDWSGKYCLPVDCTELLTPNGWVNLLDIKIGDYVAQYDKGKINFVKVEDFVSPYEAEVLKVYKTEATIDHRIWCKQSGAKYNQWKFKTWGDILSKNTYYNIPTSGQIENVGLNISDDELKLLVWVQGDGHYMKRMYKDGMHYLGIEFHLSKQRKINDLLVLLDNAGYKYTINIQSNGTTKIRIFGKNYVEHFEEFLQNKQFTYKLLKMNKRQFDIFVSELLKVDGCVENNSYCTTKKQNYDVIQALCSINNVRSNIVNTGNSSSLIFSDSNLCFSKNSNIEKRKTLVSCVTVPSGKILIRQYNQPKIVGNCPHRTLDLGWKRFLKKIEKYLNNKKPDIKEPEKGSDEEVKTYQNGSTRENVFADTNCTDKIGSLNPWEKCDCFGTFKNRAMVRYQVGKTNNYKIGYCKWLGGVK